MQQTQRPWKVPAVPDDTSASPRTARNGTGISGPQIRELGLDEAVTRVGPQWRRLIEEGDLNISLSPEFLGAAAAGAAVNDRMRVLTANEGDRVLGILPFIVRTTRMYGVPLVIIDLGGNLLSYHHEV